MKLAVTLTSVMILYSLILMAAYYVCRGICDNKGKWDVCVCVCVNWKMLQVTNITAKYK